MTSGFYFLFHIIQLATRNLRSQDKVIFFPIQDSILTLKVSSKICSRHSIFLFFGSEKISELSAWHHKSILLMNFVTCLFYLGNAWNDYLLSSGPSCSKLTMSLVNDTLKFSSSDTQISWNFLLKKMWVAFAMQKLLTFFQQKISEFWILNPLKQLTKWPLTSSLS